MIETERCTQRLVTSHSYSYKTSVAQEKTEVQDRLQSLKHEEEVKKVYKFTFRKWQPVQGT